MSEHPTPPQQRPIPPALELPLPAGAGPQTGEEIEQFTRDVIAQTRESAQTRTRALRRDRALLSVMYVLLFTVGISSAAAAVVKGLTADTGGEAAGAAVIAGLSAASFYGFFIARPLESLERNSIYHQWLTAVVNTHLLRLAYLSDSRTVAADLEDALADLVHDLKGLAHEHAAATAKAPKPDPPANHGG